MSEVRLASGKSAQPVDESAPGSANPFPFAPTPVKGELVRGLGGCVACPRCSSSPPKVSPKPPVRPWRGLRRTAKVIVGGGDYLVGAALGWGVRVRTAFSDPERDQDSASGTHPPPQSRARRLWFRVAMAAANVNGARPRGRASSVHACLG